MVIVAVTVAYNPAATAVRVPDPVMIGYEFLNTEKVILPVGIVEGGARNC